MPSYLAYLFLLFACNSQSVWPHLLYYMPHRQLRSTNLPCRPEHAPFFSVFFLLNIFFFYPADSDGGDTEAAAPSLFVTIVCSLKTIICMSNGGSNLQLFIIPSSRNTHYSTF